MKQQLSTPVIIVIIAIVVIVIGIAAWRSFGHNPAGGGPVTAEQAGLGKPMHPAIPGQSPLTPPTGTR
ncbi:MAG TPA: hypothetical protein VFB38_23295 [Chthonomonadaceae bacterium]|nr:hypothetical protein [Chthonomonadaceae bacterium]